MKSENDKDDTPKEKKERLLTLQMAAAATTAATNDVEVATNVRGSRRSREHCCLL
jgi:hypothetical protein